MSLYLGIDIGTSNMKCLALSNSGHSRIINAKPTPTWRSESQVTFFQLAGIARFVRESVAHALSLDEVSGIGFATVGESVVPLDSTGEPLADPVVWYDATTRGISTELAAESGIRDYISRGVTESYTMSVYKMLWMTREIVQLNDVHSWLPLSSYLPYMLTGQSKWDFSQACRSLLFDIHSRSWDLQTAEQLGLVGALPSITGMGEAMGETREGIPVFLGGHDHIVGISGIRDLFGKETIFSSMGSASVMGGIVDARPEEMKSQMTRVENLIVGVPRDPGEYYVEMSLRYVGKLLEMVARLFGGDDGASFYSEMNEVLGKQNIRRTYPLLVEGDLVVQERTDGVSFWNLPIDGEVTEFVHSMYLYFASMTQLVDERLGVFFNKPRIVLGGGVTKNRLLMHYIANSLDRPVELLSESELSALGAALLPAFGLKDVRIYEAVRQQLTITIVEPGRTIGGNHDQVQEYRDLLERTAVKLGVHS
jgi:L-fuculokinase